MEGMWSSQHIMKIVPNSDIILPGYLYSFLTSSFGLPMIVSGTYGAIIQHIEPSHISDLPIPRFSHGIEEQAHTYISQAAALRDAYQTGVLQATALLFESLGLKDIIPTEWRQMGQELGFSPETISADSLRAINYSPRVRQLVQRLSSAPHMPLGKICHDGMLRSGARFKRVDCDPEQGVKLIGQKELFWLEPEGRWISAKHAPQDIFVKDETIMVAAQGTLGENEVFSRAEFVTGPWTAFAFTQHLLRVRPGVPDISGAFLFAFLRSETAFRYIRSISTGSKQQDIHRHFLAQLPVPLPPIEVRRQIELLIRDAYAARHRASALEQTAIKLVEEAIEENR
jgi:type I restriction enzyme S subunit